MPSNFIWTAVGILLMVDKLSKNIKLPMIQERRYNKELLIAQSAHTLSILKTWTPRCSCETSKMRIIPILRSTALRLKCAKHLTKKMRRFGLLRCDSYSSGIPIKNNKGVIKKPLPTPNIPESMPTAKPSPINRNMFTETSAIGRYICILHLCQMLRSRQEIRLVKN